MQLCSLVAVSDALRATRSRNAKTAILSEALRSATPEEVPVVVAYLSGTLPQRRTGVGWRSLAERPAPAAAASLTVTDTDAALQRIAQVSGAGAQAERGRLLDDLLSRATAAEQTYLTGLITGETRQGALDGLMVDAVAQAAGAPLSAVRRAVMLAGSTPVVAAAVLTEGPQALARFTLSVGTPVRPMLASSAKTVSEAFGTLAGRAAFEAKLDGIRVQVHRRGEDVRVFTRTLDDITSRVPEVAAAARTLAADTLVLDGEALTLGPDGRPRPFQDSASRVASRQPTTPLSVFFFDVLHCDGTDLIDLPMHERFDRLQALAPAALLVDRLVTHSLDDAEDFAATVLAAGHEGIVAKSLDAPYEAGRRGASWVKVKPVHTLDLVVLAVEWGSGRRAGTLSNIHLGARDERGGFVMLGKTFKGMTDELLAWQTQRFLALETHRDGYVVQVRPEQVVEVAFDGLQRSSRYPGGAALRFARVLRYRHDKTADEADTLATVLDLAAR